MRILTKNITKLTSVSLLALTTLCGVNAHAQQAPFSWNIGTKNAQVDQGLAQADIQIKYDGINALPQLNVGVANGEVVVAQGEPVFFQTYWNYGAFIEYAEIRLFESQQSVQNENVLTLPVRNGVATLMPESEFPENMLYVLRVYDGNGRFDETEPKLLTFVNGELPDRVETVIPQTLTGYGIDRTALRNINVRGGSVTVFGRNVPYGASVEVLGHGVPIDSKGQFSVQTILPFGDHSVDVLVNQGGRQSIFDRDVHLNDTEFFYVAIGDLTLGTQSSDGPADFFASNDEDFDGLYLNGRGAMYMKGRVKGDYLVTGAIDTGEERIEDVFNNLDEKDPRQLLRRLDGDRFYPVYGDDSTLVEDAPTQGKFYLRVEKNDSHVMWGNFATQITGTEFAHLDRGLYGAVADFNSQSLTSKGERKTQITGFAAEPGTLPAREEYRGTGGSVYFLQRQDLSIGSERVRVEIRDKVSGLVLETRDLQAQEDYDVDYIQGRILLSDPLQSTSNDNQVVRDGALSGNDVYLVVRYEYTPSVADVDGYTFGGRATHWFGDYVRLGVTAQKEETGTADQVLNGFDMLLRGSAGTYLKAEFAQTEGPGFAQSTSTDGGFNFATLAAQGQANVKAQAYRIEGSVNLNDISGLRGRASAYFDHQDNGFSGTSRLASGDIDRQGVELSVKLTKDTEASVKYDELLSALRGTTKSHYAGVSHKINRVLSFTAGLRRDEANTPATALTPARKGGRTDVSGQIDYKLGESSSVYAFIQGTLDREQGRNKNNRFGIGGKFRMNERLSLNGELSDGDGGLGASAKATFKRSDNSEYYLGYALSADRTDTGYATQSQNLANYGTLTFGGRTRYNDSLSVYGEERFGSGRNQTSLTHAYGLTFNPSEIWSFGASIENGRIDDDVYGEFDRTALSFSVARASQILRLASNLEGRFEEGVLAGSLRDRTTYLMRNTVAFDASENWEMLGRFNFAISESDESDFLNADYVEGVLGAAYRPIYNDRLNALMKYTYFEDLAPASQISSGGSAELARQRSQIVGLDVIYDLTDRLSIGGKYGFRSGEVALDRASDDFVKSDAHLGVIRLDYHLVNQWDILGEARMLSSSLAQDTEYGALVGVYRHIGDNAKIGIGYNFSSFSDDLLDFDSDSEGVFVNMVGKF